MTDSLRGSASISTVLLRYVALWGFAVAHPLYDVISRSPEFFIAHRASRVSLAVVIVSISLLAPSLLAAVESGLSRAHEGLGRVSGWVLTTALLTAAALPFLHATNAPPWFQLGAALSGGVAAVAALSRTRGARAGIVALLSLAVVPPALLWFDSDIGMATRRAEAVTKPWQGTNGTPIVMIIFDQLPTAAIIDQEGRIDRVRWPHLADLAQASTWYRNATAVSTETIFALPAILTGKYPIDRSPPTAAAHPANLFTLLRNSYSINSFELITSLNPSDTHRNAVSALSSAVGVLNDLAFVYAHILAPREWRDRLPPVDHQVASFGSRLESIDDLESGDTRPVGFLTTNRLGQVREFVKSLKAGRFTFNFLHHMNPHHPWQLMPSGRLYSGPQVVPGFDDDWTTRWPRDPGVARAAKQRHLLQAVTVDGVIGEIVDTLIARGEFEDCLLIVTADHGITFTPGRYPRRPTKDTYRDIIYIPLFVKYPNQAAPVISDANVESVDILPTIADVLGVEDVSQHDGYSLRSDVETRGGVKTFQSTLGGDFELSQWPVAGNGEFSRIRPQTADMSVIDSDSLPWIRPKTPCDDLLGHRPSELGHQLRLLDSDSIVYNNDRTSYRGLGEKELRNGWIVGKLTLREPIQSEPLIAISVRDSIREIVRTFSTTKAQNEFSALIRDMSIGESIDDVSVFMFDPGRPRCGSVVTWAPDANTVLTFSERDPASAFAEGWSTPESDGDTNWRWALGRRAKLILPIPNGRTSLRILVGTHGRNPDQVLSIAVDGLKLGSVRVPTGEPRWIGPFEVPASAHPRPFNVVDLIFSEWNRASDRDPRELAASFYELELKQLQEPSK